jgi:hypothetical protein
VRISFTLNGVARTLSTEEVEAALRGREPERVFDYAVEVGGAWYPPKQAFTAPLGLTYRDVNSRTAYGHLSRLGFRVHDRRTDGPLPGESGPEKGEAEAGTGGVQRELALRLAVRLLAGTGATAVDATAAAEAFAAWLAG